jgi:phosphopantetheinyl transferase
MRLQADAPRRTLRLLALPGGQAAASSLAREVLEAEALRRGLPATADWVHDPGGRWIPRAWEALGWSASWSHACDALAVTLCQSGACGVDVERLDRPVRWRRLLPRVASGAEAHGVLDAAAASDDDGRRAFLHLWTRKEAALKALHRGLDADMPALVTGTGCSGELLTVLPDPWSRKPASPPLALHTRVEGDHVLSWCWTLDGWPSHLRP